MQQQLGLALSVPSLTLFDPRHIVSGPAALYECLNPRIVWQPCPSSPRQADVPMKDLDTLNTPSALFSHLLHGSATPRSCCAVIRYD
ncbi:uncharacterized [Tachysurus ichikawai]